jgi:tRNA dimethylallyltransferase
MQGIKHYLVDELEPDQEFSVAVFQEKAKQYISEIHSKGKIPIMVGGTGFYINAVLYDNDFTEDESDGSIRAELREYLNKNGREALYELLKEVDPQACDTIHINNTKRVIRAIEYFRLTGEKMSEHNKAEKQRQPVYDCKFFVLNMDRDRLYERIDKRIDIMLEQGLVKEVEELHKHYDKHLVSMQGLGYKEIIAYLDGECSLDEAVYTLKRDTRHFAKRQLTWFRHQCDGIWVDVDRLDLDGGKETAEYIYNQI